MQMQRRACARLRNAPILAGLLDAISVVGMIDQLQGPGIVFTTVDSRFEVSPERIVVREGSAVGASLGISLDGVYEIAAKRFDMQGVISPIYLLNGIGQIFTRLSQRVSGQAIAAGWWSRLRALFAGLFGKGGAQ